MLEACKMGRLLLVPQGWQGRGIQAQGLGDCRVAVVSCSSDHATAGRGLLDTAYQGHLGDGELLNQLAIEIAIRRTVIC